MGGWSGKRNSQRPRATNEASGEGGDSKAVLMSIHGLGIYRKNMAKKMGSIDKEPDIFECALGGFALDPLPIDGVLPNPLRRRFSLNHILF